MRSGAWRLLEEGERWTARDLCDPAGAGRRKRGEGEREGGTGGRKKGGRTAEDSHVEVSLSRVARGSGALGLDK